MTNPKADEASAAIVRRLVAQGILTKEIAELRGVKMHSEVGAGKED